MVETHDNFVNRLNVLGRKHEKMTHGYSTKVGKDGLIVVTAKRRRYLGGGAAIKFLLLVTIGFFAFKVFALTAFGPVTYNDRLSKLENGTIIEQIGAKALVIDPITQKVTGSVAAVLR